MSFDWNKWRREWRKRTNNATTYKYEKTPQGFLMRMYRNMKSRTAGIQKAKSHLYKGKDLLPKTDFYQWANNHDRFWELYDSWVKSNYERKLVPTVNRVDASKGYTIGNMEWLTHSENSRLTSRLKLKI